MDSFIPPNSLPKQPEWATYLPDRRPQFKTHSNRGQGLNAIRNSSGGYPRSGILYHFKDGWQEIMRFDASIEHTECERCGKPIRELSSGYPRNYYITWQWNKKIPKLEATCSRKCV